MFYGTYFIMGVCDATQAHIHSLFDDPLPGNHLRLQDVTWPSHNVFIEKPDIHVKPLNPLQLQASPARPLRAAPTFDVLLIPVRLNMFPFRL